MSFALSKYRSARTTTASPGQILIQLYDGAVRFMRQAQIAIEEKDPAARGRSLSRAHAIISELQATLHADQAPDLCAQLYSLYDFILFRITEANRKADGALLDSPIKVLGELREGWQEALSREAQAQSADPQASAALAAQRG